MYTLEQKVFMCILICLPTMIGATMDTMNIGEYSGIYLVCGFNIGVFFLAVYGTWLNY